MIDCGPVDDACREYRRCPCQHHRERVDEAMEAELVARRREAFRQKAIAEAAS